MWKNTELSLSNSVVTRIAGSGMEKGHRLEEEGGGAVAGGCGRLELGNGGIGLLMARVPGEREERRV